MAYDRDRWENERNRYRDDDRDRYRREHGAQDRARYGVGGEGGGRGFGERFGRGEFGGSENAGWDDYRERGREEDWRTRGGSFGRDDRGEYGRPEYRRDDYGRNDRLSGGYEPERGRYFGRADNPRSRDEGWSGGSRGSGEGYGSDYGRRSGYGWGRSEAFGRGYARDERSRDLYGRDDDRGWLDRASDEVSSWFGDEDAERRRREDARRDEHRGRGPRGYTRSDERIREDVSDRLTDHPAVDASDIEVSVSHGEVTLSGQVESRHAKRLAEDVAERVSGVTHVQNNLRVRQYTAENQQNWSRQGTGQQTGGTALSASVGSSAGVLGDANSGKTGSTASGQTIASAPKSGSNI